MTDTQRLLLLWRIEYDDANTIGVTKCGKYILMDGEFLKCELKRAYHMGAIYYTAFRLKKRFSWARMNRLKKPAAGVAVEIIPF